MYLICIDVQNTLHEPFQFRIKRIYTTELQDQTVAAAIDLEL